MRRQRLVNRVAPQRCGRHCIFASTVSLWCTQSTEVAQYLLVIITIPYTRVIKHSPLTDTRSLLSIGSQLSSQLLFIKR